MPVPVIEDFQQVAPRRVSQHCQPPIIEHQHIRLGDLRQQLGITSVTMRNHQFLKQSGHAASATAHSRTEYSAYSTPNLSLIHISEPTRLGMISYAVFCLTK